MALAGPGSRRLPVARCSATLAGVLLGAALSAGALGACSRHAPTDGPSLDEGPTAAPPAEDLWPGLLPTYRDGADAGKNENVDLPFLDLNVPSPEVRLQLEAGTPPAGPAASGSAAGGTTSTGATGSVEGTPTEAAPLPPPPGFAEAPWTRARSAAGDAGADAGSEAPLRAWMKENSAKAVLASDFERLRESFTRIAGLAPPSPGYENWVSIAQDGANAARVLHLEAVKAACRGCHQQYRDRYRRERRGAPLPS